MKYRVTVLWDGALDDERTFYDYSEVERYAENLMSLAEQERAQVEIYVLECTCDDDDDDSDCQCVQYATSLQPAYSYAP